MVHRIPQLAWMAEADGHIFWYNQRVEYNGTTCERWRGAIGKPSTIRRGSEGLTRWKTRNCRGVPFEMDFPLLGETPFGVVLTRVCPPKIRKQRGAMLAQTDITELKRADEMRARWPAVVTHPDDRIIARSGTGTITAESRRREGVRVLRIRGGRKLIQMIIPPERAT